MENGRENYTVSRKPSIVGVDRDEIQECCYMILGKLKLLNLTEPYVNCKMNGLD